MLNELEGAGLGPNDVVHLQALYEQARQAEEKGSFNTGGLLVGLVVDGYTLTATCVPPLLNSTT
jgi:hypothetical protein